MREIIFVVADKFRGFATNTGVYAYSDFVKALVRDDAWLRDVEMVVLGQGLAAESIDILEEAIACSERRDGPMVFVPAESREDVTLVHKRKRENVLVSIPRRVGENEYRAWMMVDERCAEMSDHVTGQHVQGLVLIEASRQMMMAAVEAHAFEPGERGTYQYVLNEFDVRYEQFAFPLDVAVHLSILRYARDERGVLDLELAVEFIQGDVRVCHVRCVAHGYPSRWIARMEARRAQQVVSAARALFANGPEGCPGYRQLGVRTLSKERVAS